MTDLIKSNILQYLSNNTGCPLSYLILKSIGMNEITLTIDRVNNKAVLNYFHNKDSLSSKESTAIILKLIQVEKNIKLYSSVLMELEKEKRITRLPNVKLDSQITLGHHVSHFNFSQEITSTKTHNLLMDLLGRVFLIKK